MRLISALFAFAALMISGAVASYGEVTEISRCVIEVDGKVYQDGPCTRTELSDDGSFVLRGNGEPSTFAYIDAPTEETPYYGTWNGPSFGGHAHDTLGELTEDGPCLTNDRVRVCIWPTSLGCDDGDIVYRLDPENASGWRHQLPVDKPETARFDGFDLLIERAGEELRYSTIGGGTGIRTRLAIRDEGAKQETLPYAFYQIGGHAAPGDAGYFLMIGQDLYWPACP